MRIHIFIVGTILFLSSCQKDSKQNSLSYINHVNKLELVAIDDQCGEWGGNEKSVTIYREDLKGPLLADYLEKTKDCDSGKEPKITRSIKRIELTDEEGQLILESIDELSRNKIAREDYPAHSGLYNRILLSDSSLIINDFPSVEWTKFKVLAASLNGQ